MTSATIRSAILLVICLTAPPAAVLAQQPRESEAATADGAELRARADAALKAKDWPRAIELFEQVTQGQPGDAQAWHDLGYSLHSAGRYEEGLAADMQAVMVAEAGTRVYQTSTYNVACALAMLGRADEALDWLQHAVEAGYRNPEFMEYDPELKSLRGEQRFRDLMASLRAGRSKVAIVVHEGVEMLDFAGPAEVFSQASDADGTPLYDVMLVGLTHDPVAAQGVHGTIVPQYSIDDCPQPDIVVVPGGDTGVLRASEPFMAWIVKVEGGTRVMMSVCTGAFVYAQAGLLDGLPATTHFSAIDGLRRVRPGLEVREGVRFVDNGHVITTAGISAGIDGALEVVRRQAGEASAAGAARSMEYVWHRD